MLMSIDRLKALDPLASLIPPPLVDLGLAHASSASDLENLLTSPHELAVLKFFDEYVQLSLGLASSLVADQWLLVYLFNFGLLTSILRRLLLSRLGRSHPLGTKVLCDWQLGLLWLVLVPKR